MSKTSLFSFLGVVLLALLFRISYLATIEFKADEAIALFLSAKPLFGDGFAVGSSVSSVGIINPPLFVYLLSPFTFISIDPQFISGIIGFLNAVSVGAFFLIIKKYYGQKTAVFASLLFAVSPWAIIFSRKIWTQDLILPLFIPTLYALHKIIIDKKSAYWFLYALLTVLLLQLHQSLIFFFIPLNVFLLLQKPSYKKFYIFLGLLIGLLPLIPYLTFAARDNFLGSTNPNPRFYAYSLQLFMRPFQIMHQGDFFPLFGNDVVQFAKENYFLYKLRVLFYAEYLLLPLGIIVFWKKFKQIRMLVYATVFLPFLYLLFRINPEMHYFIILLPLLFLFLGTAFSYLYNKTIFLRYLSTTLFALLITLSVFFNFSFFTFIVKNQGLQGTYGKIFTQTDQTIKKQIQQFEGIKDYNEILLLKFVPENAVVDATSLLLFDRAQTKDNLYKLDEKMMKTPVDPRVEYEVLAYYTAFPPTHDDVITLRQKNKTIPSYWYIYDRTYGIYLSNHLKQKYVNQNLGIGFEYPEHWKIEKNKNEFTLFGDNANLSLAKQQPNFSFDSLQKESIQFIDQKVEKLTCVTKDNSWCGTSIGPLPLQDGSYFLWLNPTKNSKILDKELDTIIGSFYYL